MIHFHIHIGLIVARSCQVATLINISACTHPQHVRDRSIRDSKSLSLVDIDPLSYMTDGEVTWHAYFDARVDSRASYTSTLCLCKGRSHTSRNTIQVCLWDIWSAGAGLSSWSGWGIAYQHQEKSGYDTAETLSYQSIKSQRVSTVCINMYKSSRQWGVTGCWMWKR